MRSARLPKPPVTAEDEHPLPVPPRLSVDVLIEDDGWAALPDVEALVERAVGAAASGADVPLRDHAEVSVLLTGDAAVKALNAQWRGKDKPTNVLSFPAVAPGALETALLLGDIALAFQTVAREAVDEGKPLTDHLTHLVIHGFLHLLGHDHDDQEAADRMENLERQVLAGLGVPDPYRHDT
jgi:probable rRNA maturation factor